MSKAQSAKQPSIEDLLASIRQAIHDDVAPDGSLGSQWQDRPALAPARTEAAASGSGNVAAMATGRNGEADASLAVRTGAPALSAAAARAEEVAHGTAKKRAMVTTDREGFAGLLGGDVRLEEALARLSQAGRRPAAAAAAQSAKPAAEATPQAPPPRLRPSIDEPVERFQPHTQSSQPQRPDPQTSHRLAGEPAPPPSEARHGQAHEEAHARPPWLRPEGLGAASQSAKAAQEEAAAEADTLWDDGRDEAEHEVSASTLEPASDLSGQTGQDLLSSTAAAAASSAFNRLADAIVDRSTGGERSIEDITRELLRPMLKNWLDENLPHMVERLVREEIERVARKGR